MNEGRQQAAQTESAPSHYRSREGEMMDLGDSYHADRERLEVEETRKRPPSEIRQRVESVSHSRGSLAESSDPDSMPEMMREITMLRGAISGVAQWAAELVVKAQPVMRVTAQEIVEADRRTGARNAPATVTEVGVALRALQGELGEIETFLQAATDAISL